MPVLTPEAWTTAFLGLMKEAVPTINVAITDLQQRMQGLGEGAEAIKPTDWKPHVESREQSDQRCEQPPPFQLFVRSFDGILLTLTMPDGPDTSIGRLQELVENRTGITPSEQHLATGTKPVNALHAHLPISDYGIQREQTLTMQQTLKGGFGERAAVNYVCLQNITHGNVLGDIHITQGKSKAEKDFMRACTTLHNELADGTKVPNKFAQGFLATIADEAVKTGLVTDSEKENWVLGNMHFITAVGVVASKAANCGDFTQLVYSHLLSSTKGQTVYQVVMEGKSDSGHQYDHQFVVTSPQNHGPEIAKLAGDKEAMVVDAWWVNTICPFSKFVARDNPYQEPIALRNLRIVQHGDATQTDIGNHMANFINNQFNTYRNTYAATLDQWAKANHASTTALVNALDDVAILEQQINKFDKALVDLGGRIDAIDLAKGNWSDRIRSLKRQLAENRPRAMSIEAEFRAVQNNIDNFHTLPSEMQTPQLLQKWGSDFHLAQQKLKEATHWWTGTLQQLHKAEGEFNELEKQRALAERDRQNVEQASQQTSSKLNDAQDRLKTAEEAIPGTFGDVRTPWVDSPRDTRTPLELAQGLDKALKQGGFEQFKKELGYWSDSEFGMLYKTNSRFVSVVSKDPDLSSRAKNLKLL